MNSRRRTRTFGGANSVMKGWPACFKCGMHHYAPSCPFIHAATACGFLSLLDLPPSPPAATGPSPPHDSLHPLHRTLPPPLARYYNLSSLVWKGVRLENRMGSAAFAALTAELLLLSHGLVVVGSWALAQAIPEYK